MLTEIVLSKKGRDRKQGERYPSGGLKRQQGPDRGADYAKEIREFEAAGKAPELTSYPLGKMLANSDICYGRFAAGCLYARLHWQRHGRLSLAAVSYDGVSGGQGSLLTRLSDEEAAKAEKKLKGAQAVLMAAGRAIKDTIDNLVVYERTPRWMRPTVPRDSDMVEGDRAKKGLFLLAKHFGIRMGES